LLSYQKPITKKNGGNMTLPKKHYVAIAKILKEEFRSAYESDVIYYNDCKKSSLVVASLYFKLVDYFESENPRFDRDIFEKATALSEEEMQKINK
jgi:hypothetical protein